MEFYRAACNFAAPLRNSAAPRSPAALRLPVERRFYLAAAILKFRLSLKFGLIARRGTKFKKRKQIFYTIRLRRKTGQRFKFMSILKFRAADKFKKLIKNSILREGGHIGLYVLLRADKRLDFAIFYTKAAAERRDRRGLPALVWRFARLQARRERRRKRF